MMPAMFTCARTAGWSAHILEQKRLGRLVRPAAVYDGPATRTPDSVEGFGLLTLNSRRLRTARRAGRAPGTGLTGRTGVTR